MSATVTQTPTIVGLDDPAALDPALTGRKAASLAALKAAGFDVPGGFVITTAACAALRDAAARSLEAEPVAMAVPDRLRAELNLAVASLGDVALAVRSSGVGEDLAEASFAGQYETVLDVRGGDAVTDALRRCLVSAQTRHVAAYRAEVAIGAAAPMAVLVQVLVSPDVAGVAFSANPVTGDRDQVLVSAVRGLGDRLVSGDTTPDEWTVRGGTATCLDAPEGVLEPDQVIRIADLARRVEAHSRSPQDLEWALAGDRVYLLQARPVTALPQPPQLEIPAEGFWTKDTQHYPTPMTPFGASVYLPALDAAMTAMRDDFGLLFDGMRQISLGGDVYMRAIPPGGKDRPVPPWWVLALACRIAPPLRWRVRAAARALRDDLPRQLVERWDRELREQFRSEAAGLRATDLTALDDRGLIAHFDRSIDLLRRGECVHFRLFGAYAIAMYEFAQVCKELLAWDAGTSLQLLAGNSGASAAPTVALDELADFAGNVPAVLSAFDAAEVDPVTRLMAADATVAAGFADYLERFGHRPAGSYDPGAATLAERPELLVALVRDRVRAGSSGAADRHEDLLDRARQQLADRSQEERARFERAYTTAAHVYTTREDNVLILDGEPSGLLRYTALEFGRRLVQRHLLTRPEDAVWLEDAELRSALLGEEDDIRQAVGRRRAEHAWVAAHPGPASYGPEPGSPPNLRGLPRALRHVMNALLWNMNLMSPEAAEVPADALVAGVAGSPGSHTGAVRIIRGEAEFGRLRPGDVLVCPTTSPVWSVLFGQAGALVTDQGGLLSHPAVIAREHHIPAVLATGDATRRLRDGQVVTADGTRGLVLPHEDRP
jgi:rifampicin phosphotransferase